MIKWIINIDSGYFNAGAIFEKEEGTWRCVDAAPIIKWMIGKPPNDIRKYVKKRRWRYEWTKVRYTT